MNNNVKEKKFNWQLLLATWFYVGKIPIAPGTFGTIAAFPLCYLLIIMSSSLEEIRIFFFTAIIVISIFGYIAIQDFHKKTDLIDHKSIVVDEVIGIMLIIGISYQWLIPIALKIAPTRDSFEAIITIFIIATVIFRFFDIRKPFLIRTIERQMPNAFGVILDDVLAAIYSSLLLFFIAKFYH